MKPLSEQDHYEILEIARGAEPEDIERAYRLAQATYADDSLAGYSMMSEGDAEALRERIETAYRVLSDEEARRTYDESLSVEEAEETARPAAATARPEISIPLDDLDDEVGDFDGARLRRARLRRGTELEDIAAVTKINPAYLRFIEEDRFAELPARVYVRGFVMAYAQCVGLDPKRVAVGYMKHYESHCEDQRRSRFFGVGESAG